MSKKITTLFMIFTMVFFGFQPMDIYASGIISKIITSVSTDHTLAITTDGKLYAWGLNNYGQLGDGTQINKTTPTKILEDVVSAAIGECHSLAITTDGALYVWGSNLSGALGVGGYTGSIETIPVKVLDNIDFVAAGGRHSFAITTDGTLYGWGSNPYGVLGDGTTMSKTTPTKILDNVISVATGAYHSLALTTDGTLYAWGSNLNGELGHNLSTTETPTKILDNVGFATTGLQRSFAITTDGILYAWGYSGGGILVDGTYTDIIIPTKILDNVTSVAAGSSHNLVITTDGILYIWGDNTYGQLGDGTYSKNVIPTKILDNVTSVAAGSNQSFAITIDGTLYAWGNNVYGRLGDGTTTNKATPVQIIFPRDEDTSAPITSEPVAEVTVINDGTIDAESLVGSSNALKVGDIIIADVTIGNVSNIYAEDFEIQYDNTKLEYMGIESIENMFNYKINDTNGSLRFITASKGAEYGITGKGIVAKLMFRVTSTGSATIKPVNVKIADHIKTETALIEENHIGINLFIEESSLESITFTLGDLAYLAYHYGEDTSVLDEYFQNVLKDGTIDDISLSIIVGKILGN